MKTEEIIERSQKIIAPYRVTSGKKFRLKDVDPDDTGKSTSEDKPRAKELLERGVEVLAELQDVLYAQDQWSILLIFQAMDGAGKDGATRTRLLEGLHEGLRGHDMQHRYRLRPVVRRTRRQQVVHAGYCRGGCHRRTSIVRPSISGSRCSAAPGNAVAKKELTANDNI